MQGQLRAIHEAVARNAAALTDASGRLTEISQSMAAGAEETAAQAGVASTASDEVSAHAATVAAGIEQMQATIGEISQGAQHAATTATDAVQVARSTETAIETARGIQRRDRQRHRSDHLDRGRDEHAGAERDDRSGPGR